MRGHVFERFGSVFGASEGGCAVSDALVLVVTDRRGFAGRSSLDEHCDDTAQCGENGALNASYVPHDEAAYGVLRCAGGSCGETIGLDRVSCRNNSRELWFSTTKTMRCDPADDHDAGDVPLHEGRHSLPPVAADMS